MRGAKTYAVFARQSMHRQAEADAPPPHTNKEKTWDSTTWSRGMKSKSPAPVA
jgi:hypothetical protein